jgi:hypothetical protein
MLHLVSLCHQRDGLMVDSKQHPCCLLPATYQVACEVSSALHGLLVVLLQYFFPSLISLAYIASQLALPKKRDIKVRQLTHTYCSSAGLVCHDPA